MSTESFVQGAPDSTGKQVDTFTVTDPLTAATKHRQAVVTADPNNAGNVQGVTAGGEALVRSFTLEDLMLQLLVEMRIHSIILQDGLTFRGDIDVLRASEFISTLQQNQ